MGEILKFKFYSPARQNGDFGRILPIFRSFSTYFPPMVPHLSFLSPRTCLWNLPISAYFCLFSAYFPLNMVPHPSNSSMEPICCFSAHMFMDPAYFLLIFHSFSTYFAKTGLLTLLYDFQYSKSFAKLLIKSAKRPNI